MPKKKRYKQIQQARKVLYLSFVVDKAAIYCFKVQILGNICMNEDTDKIAIGHHKLAKEADNPFSINFKHNLSWSRREQVK